jgi:hypothetical protein
MPKPSASLNVSPPPRDAAWSPTQPRFSSRLLFGVNVSLLALFGGLSWLIWHKFLFPRWEAEGPGVLAGWEFWFVFVCGLLTLSFIWLLLRMTGPRLSVESTPDVASPGAPVWVRWRLAPGSGFRERIKKVDGSLLISEFWTQVRRTGNRTIISREENMLGHSRATEVEIAADRQSGILHFEVPPTLLDKGLVGKGDIVWIAALDVKLRGWLSTGAQYRVPIKLPEQTPGR